MLSTVFMSFLALAASVSALTPANTANPPSGNPIGHPGLDELIPAGQSFTITWTPTDPADKISLVLLRGPSTNAVANLTIADSIANTGSYVWPVPDTLEPDTTHYGVQLIVEGTGAYQYSPQCGVANPTFSGTSTDDSGVKSNAAGSPPSSSGTASGSAEATTTLTASAFSQATGLSGTGTAGNFSIPVLSPTKAITKPASLTTETSTFSPTVAATTEVQETPSPTQSQASASSGAAVREKMSLGGLAVAGLVGVLVL